MYQKKLEKDIRCPLEYGLSVFGGKWKSRIICVLAAKETLRYSELRKEMANITDAVLATTLKELIADGIIDAAAEVGMNIPLVARFEGTNRDEAENVLKRAGLPLTLVRNMEDAADEILRLVREGE